MSDDKDNGNLLDLSVVIPAYNEEQAIASVIEKTIDVLDDMGLDYEVIVVDDGSQDATARVAGEAGADVLTHTYNMGNGAAVKTGIRAAKGEIILMMDGDGQHDPQEIPSLLEKMDVYDMVVGSRTKDSETDAHRDFGNTLYNLLASYICNRKIKDLTSGFRAFKAEIGREFLHLLPNTFSYPTTITLAVARSGYPFAYHPIQVARRKGQSKINIVRDGARFLLIIFKVATLFSPLKVFIPASLGLFSLGFGYGLFKVIVLDSRYGPTSAMLMTMAGLIFLIGLVSEQLTQLRYER